LLYPPYRQSKQKVQSPISVQIPGPLQVERVLQSQSIELQEHLAGIGMLGVTQLQPVVGEVDISGTRTRGAQRAGT
jgi:hypothetical protein